MNPYLKNLNRMEFLITLACTGRCKHCSEGEHTGSGLHLDGDIAAQALHELCGKFSIKSVMTFGGEPLLYSDEVCKIHTAARECNIPKRQLITNGFFSQEEKKIFHVAENLAQSGVTDILLSVDAFHQDTIPLAPVKAFAKAVKLIGIPIRVHPAWLVDSKDKNPYNLKTLDILAEFSSLEIGISEGNAIFPSGNALKYLRDYFDLNKEYISPYTQDPKSLQALCVAPDGGLLNGNLYENDILSILENYSPQ